MIVLFPSDPLDPRKVDPAFAREAEYAKVVGAQVATVNIDVTCKMRGLPGPKHAELPHPTIYRGWMLKSRTYRGLYRAALRNGALLINSPDDYRFCHELPQWYPNLKGSTPESVWFEPNEKLGFELRSMTAEVRDKLGNGPYVVKDYVKSRKHEWDTACYIPDIGKLVEVTRAFLELQGDDLNGGLVYRKYVPLRRVGTHPKSGAPIFNEVRVWFLAGIAIANHAYWGPSEGGEDIERPRGQFFTGEPVSSNFYTMDLAQLEDGNWVIIELGDGQVSGLPEHVSALVLYDALRKRFAYPGKTQ